MSSYFGEIRFRKRFDGLLRGQSADGQTHQPMPHFDALIHFKQTPERVM